MVKINWIIVFVSILFWNCSKNNECFNYNQKELSTMEISTDSINEIELYNNMVFDYIESPENKIFLEFPSDLKNNIESSLTNHTLSIINTVGCRILRNNSKDIIRVTLYQKTLPKVILHNQSSFISTNKITQKLNIETFVSSGVIDLELDNNSTVIKLESSAMNVNLKGKTNYMYIYSLGTGVINAKNLDANTLHINNQSTGDAQIKAGKYDDAIATYQALLVRFPKSAFVYNYFRKAYAKKGDTGKAKEYEMLLKAAAMYADPGIYGDLSAHHLGLVVE